MRLIGTSGSNSVAYFVLRIYEGGYNKKEKYDPPTSRCGADEVYENPTDTLWKIRAGAISAPLSVFSKNIGQDDAFRRNPGANIHTEEMIYISLSRWNSQSQGCCLNKRVWNAVWTRTGAPHS